MLDGSRGYGASARIRLQGRYLESWDNGLELAKGYAPYAKYPPMKVLLMTIQEPPPSLDTYDDNEDINKWSRSFRDIIRLCLQKDAKKRPTIEQLLNHRHFKGLSDNIFLDSRRQQLKKELCDIIDDVGMGEGGYVLVI